MTTKETLQIMAVLQGAYPRYYAGQSYEEKKQAAELWHRMLGEYPYELVDQAIAAVIATNVFPPAIAEIIAEVNSLQRGPEMTELEAWSYVSRAIRNAAYHAQEEWEKLPEELRGIISPDLLRSWARVEAENVETVLQSNFARTFRAGMARRRKYDALPGSVKQYMAQIGVRTDGLLCMPGQRAGGMDPEIQRLPV